MKHEIDHGKEISFKVIHVKPETLRTTIELELIEKLKPIWNIHVLYGSHSILFVKKNTCGFIS